MASRGQAARLRLETCFLSLSLRQALYSVGKQQMTLEDGTQRFNEGSPPINFSTEVSTKDRNKASRLHTQNKSKLNHGRTG